MERKPSGIFFFLQHLMVFFKKREYTYRFKKKRKEGEAQRDAGGRGGII